MEKREDYGIQGIVENTKGTFHTTRHYSLNIVTTIEWVNTIHIHAEAVVQRCSVKKVRLKISQNS